VKINVGCGNTPTPGWLNLDNSWTVRLSRRPAVMRGLRRLGLASDKQLRYATVARERNIQWANVVQRIPVADGAADVVYSSHMLEHLERPEARRFLREAARVLKPDGILRIVVPDLQRLVAQYLESGDGDQLVSATLLAVEKPRALAQRLRWAVVGYREHAWMYDGPSLARFVSGEGFVDTVVLPAGETTIPDPGPLNLYERHEESVYVEARKRGSARAAPMVSRSAVRA